MSIILDFITENLYSIKFNFKILEFAYAQSYDTKHTFPI